MPLIDITRPEIIKFLNESYEKENNLRVNWNAKHQEKINQAATLSREPTGYFENDVIAYNMGEGLMTVTRDHVVAGYNRRRTPIRDGISMPRVKDLRDGYTLPKVGLGDPKVDPRLEQLDSDLSPGPMMRPVDPVVQSLIYSSPSYREEYMVERSKILPEKRYYFAECVNWDYGWRLKDSKASTRAIYGKSAQLQRALATRVGPQPDPPYYKSADLPDAEKCVAN